MVGLAVVPVLLVCLARSDLAAFFSPAQIARWAIAAAMGITLGIAASHLKLPEAVIGDRINAIVTAVVSAGVSVSVAILCAYVLGVTEVRRATSRMWQIITRAWHISHG